MNLLADKRAELVTAMAKKMDISDAYHAEIDELSKDVHPEDVIDTMEHFTESQELNSNK